MKAVSAVLSDRRRSQRGGVLSGVLIMTAFIAILSGALMTALSGNFLLSYNQINTATNEATVNSGLEAALNQFQIRNVSDGCPQDLSSAQAHLNGRYAMPSLTSCWLNYKEQSPMPLSVSLGAGGSHSVVSRANQDLYVVGNSAGKVYQFQFGQTTLMPGWPMQLPGAVSGPPVTLPNFGGDNDDLLTLVPLAVPQNQPAGCESGACVAVVMQEASRAPQSNPCYMSADGRVTTGPALGVNFPSVIFFGDQTGALFAFNQSCGTELAESSGSQPPVVAGPFVFQGQGQPNGTNSTDEVYVVTSDSVIHYTYSVNPSPKLNAVSVLPLQSSGPALGATIDRSSLPAMLAITSARQLISVQLQTSFDMQIVSQVQMPTSVNVITAPSSDWHGDWFVGASDGNVHELQQPAGQPIVDVAQFPLGGTDRGSVQVGPCSTILCMYVGAQDGGQFLVPLDARDVVLSVCISITLLDCSGANPRLWAKVEIGSLRDVSLPLNNSNINKQSVHVQGWSYYSPN